MLPALEKVPALSLPDPSSLSLAQPQLSGGGGLAVAVPSVSYAGGGTLAPVSLSQAPAQAQHFAAGAGALAPNQVLRLSHGQTSAQPQHFVDPATGQLYTVAPAHDQGLGAAAAATGGAALQAQAQIAHSVAMANLAQARRPEWEAEEAREVSVRSHCLSPLVDLCFYLYVASVAAQPEASSWSNVDVSSCGT